MSNRILKEVAEAEAVIARIKNKPTESELIEEQKEREPEEKESEEDSGCYVHSLDNHAHSYIFTPAGSGIFRGETTYTPMLERKKR